MFPARSVIYSIIVDVRKEWHSPDLPTAQYAKQMEGGVILSPGVMVSSHVSHPPPSILSLLSLAPCVVPHISHGYVDDRASGSSVGHNQSIAVQCLSQFQPTTNLTTVCNNGTWSSVPKCIPAKCTELPTAPRNGMVVAPNLDHGMVGKFEVSLVSIKIVLWSWLQCRDGYMLKGNNTTQCYFGNWTGMTPWCKEGNLDKGAGQV